MIDSKSIERTKQASQRDRPAPLIRTRPPAGLLLDTLHVRYGAVDAVNNLSLRIEPGEFLALLGPSGSGKTTILMSVAGFIDPTAGDILLDGKSILRLPPESRGIGVVFQGYALFPHLSVFENVAFPLEMSGRSRSDSASRVGQALETVGMSGFGQRLPRQLSGGQQQRVALARALVFGPPLLLLDEPLGALDKQLRSTMQHEFRMLHREVGTTIVYVTHDQHEALAMADRVAVMHQGNLVQVGPPHEIYGAPTSRFVAEFIGDCNFLPLARIERVQGGCRAYIQDYAGHVPASRVISLDAGSLAIRPHQVVFQEDGVGLPAEAIDMIYLGELREYLLGLRDGSRIRLRQLADSAGRHLSSGDQIWIGWDWSQALLF